MSDSHCDMQNYNLNYQAVWLDLVLYLQGHIDRTWVLPKKMTLQPVVKT